MSRLERDRLERYLRTLAEMSGQLLPPRDAAELIGMVPRIAGAMLARAAGDPEYARVLTELVDQLETPAPTWWRGLD